MIELRDELSRLREENEFERARAGARAERAARYEALLREVLQAEPEGAWFDATDWFARARAAISEVEGEKT